MTAEEWLRSNITFENDPCEGSSFISPEGKFVNLHSVGWEHLDLLRVLEDYGIESQEEELIPGLENYIRCNEGYAGGYSYIELRDVRPTWDQFDAIEKWIDFVLSRHKEVSVVYITYDDYEEETYSNKVTGDQVVKSIKRAYGTGKLIESSAFESVKSKAKNKQPEPKDYSDIKIHWDSSDDGFGNTFEAYYSDIDNGYVGIEGTAKMLKKKGIVPQLARADHNVCSIGFSEKDQKWYGWSHRAIHGFGVGDEIPDKEGIIGLRGFKCNTLEDCKKAAIAFAEGVS